jgi:hypothetical protein
MLLDYPSNFVSFFAIFRFCGVSFAQQCDLATKTMLADWNSLKSK